jgi:hypothetical protein
MYSVIKFKTPGPFDRDPDHGYPQDRIGVTAVADNLHDLAHKLKVRGLIYEAEKIEAMTQPDHGIIRLDADSVLITDRG